MKNNRITKLLAVAVAIITISTSIQVPVLADDEIIVDDLGAEDSDDEYGIVEVADDDVTEESITEETENQADEIENDVADTNITETDGSNIESADTTDEEAEETTLPSDTNITETDDFIPDDSVSEDTVIDETVSNDSISENTVSDDSVSCDSVSDNSVSENEVLLASDENDVDAEGAATLSMSSKKDTISANIESYIRNRKLYGTDEAKTYYSSYFNVTTYTADDFYNAYPKYPEGYCDLQIIYGYQDGKNTVTWKVTKYN